MDLMEATYEKGENISDENVLNKYAEKYGIKNWNMKENIEEVYKDFEVTKNKYKIDDVPYYIFNNNIKIYGLQTPEYFDLLCYILIVMEMFIKQKKKADFIWLK